ncbi:MAG: hypothetical protein AAGD25_18305 [Cyanobacteria bacterium P01_F01_bin.150]
MFKLKPIENHKKVKLHFDAPIPNTDGLTHEGGFCSCSRNCNCQGPGCDRPLSHPIGDRPQPIITKHPIAIAPLQNQNAIANDSVRGDRLYLII